MPLQTACPHCNRQYTLPDDKEGKTAKCKGCEELFVIKPLAGKPLAKKAKAAIAPTPSQKKAPPPEDDDEEAEKIVADDEAEKVTDDGEAGDDADEEEERPSRKASKKSKKKGKRHAKSGALMWALLAGGGVLALLVFGGGGIGLYLLFWAGGRTSVTPGNPVAAPGAPALPGLGAILPVAHVTEEAFDQLRTGMTEDEAVAVIGPPTTRVGPDKSAPEPVLRPGVVTETDLVQLTWMSGKNKIEVTMDMHHKAMWGKGWFDDGQGGLFELFGNKFDQLALSPEQGQRVLHRRPDGSSDPPPQKPAAPPGPAKVAFSKLAGLSNAKTAGQVLQFVGEPPTKKLGPQLMPDGTQSADTWEWDNGNGFLKVHFNASGMVVGTKNKDLPFF